MEMSEGCRIERHPRENRAEEEQKMGVREKDDKNEEGDYSVGGKIYTIEN